MLELERLAKDQFERYCLETTGKQGSWIYLDGERKIAWMKEVIYITDFLAKEIKAKIKPLPPIKQNDTVYNMGYQSGLYEERSATINLIQYVDQDLKQQLETYKKQLELIKQQD